MCIQENHVADSLPFVQFDDQPPQGFSIARKGDGENVRLNPVLRLRFDAPDHLLIEQRPELRNGIRRYHESDSNQYEGGAKNEFRSDAQSSHGRFPTPYLRRQQNFSAQMTWELDAETPCHLGIDGDN